MKYTRFHFNIRNWKESLKENILRCANLCEKFPEDSRYEATIKEMNVYEILLNILEGNPDAAITQELWEWMTQISKESDGLKLKSYTPIKENVSEKETIFEPITTSVESQGEVTSDILAQSLNEVITVEKPKRKKKVTQE